MKNIKKSIFVLTILMLSFLVVISPAKAISDGELDRNDHPYVGLIVADDADGNPLWRGSGTLISPRVFLTAGHVCEAPAARATIWFQSDVDAGRPDNGYPFGAKKFSVDGTCYTHPLYALYPWYLHDLGVVILDKPVKMKEYGALPELGVLDELESKKDAFTAVGFGLQGVKPIYQADRVRYQTTLNLVNLYGTAGVPAGNCVMVSGNTNTGGTCFGDSGGPLFLGDTNIVAAVTSFGLNYNCAGIGGGYRVDTADDLDWLYGEFGKLL